MTADLNSDLEVFFSETFLESKGMRVLWNTVSDTTLSPKKQGYYNALFMLCWV